MQNRFSVEVMPWSDALPLARPVREQVFIVEQGVPRELEWDDWDARSDHVVAFASERKAIGTARLLPDGHIGRMAVLKDWRGQGVGSALFEALLELARAKGMVVVALNAQTHAAGFYRRFGFRQEGEEFVEAGIPHVAMRLTLTPPA
jgi:predicted GNAT family N-acyltransferase